MKTALSDPGGAKDSRSPCPPAWTCLYHFASGAFDEDAPIQDSIAACANIEFDAMSPLASLTIEKEEIGSTQKSLRVAFSRLFQGLMLSCSYVLASRQCIYEMSTIMRWVLG